MRTGPKDEKRPRRRRHLDECACPTVPYTDAVCYDRRQIRDLVVGDVRRRVENVERPKLGYPN